MVRTIVCLLAVLITACGGARAARDVVEPAAIAPVAVEADESVDAVEHAPSPTVLEIALPGDGRVFAHALGTTPCVGCAGQDGDVIALLATDGTGVTRHAIDVDAGRATQVGSVTLDAYPEHATYDRARDLFWWTTSGEQHRIPTRGERGPRERVLIRSQRVGTLAGVQTEIRVCPEPPSPPADPRGRGRRGGAVIGRGTIGSIGGALSRLCDHRITALLPVSSGLLIGGSIAIDSLASPQPWLGLVSPDGTLLGATRLDVPMDEGWVDGLVASDAGVFVFVWSRSGSGARGQLVLLREGTLETVTSTPLEMMSSSTQPWSALAAAPDGGLWMVVPRFREQLVLVVAGRDGAIVREQTIPGVTLPVTSTQHLAVRGGAPWLAIAEPYAEPTSRLRLVRLDPVSGAMIEHHEAALPERFYAERMLGTERGFALAGRVDVSRPAVLWVLPPPSP